MRLAYLVSKYPSENHTYILREIAGLRARGFDIEVVAISPDDRSPDEVSAAELAARDATFVVKSRGAARIVVDNVAALARHPAGYIRGLLAARRLAGLDVKRMAYNLAYLAEAAVVGRWMLRRGLQRVHVHYASTVGLLVSEMFGVGVSATIHGSAEFINPDLQRIPEKVRAFDLVVAISKYGRSQLMLNSDPAHWSKIHVVPLGVDVAPTPARRPRVEDGLFRISCVGQLQPAKGLHILLDAVALLRTRGHVVHVTLVGDGPYRDGLARHAGALGVESDVTFTGRLNQEQVRNVYARSDAFVLASFAEGVPVVLMEAMASGIASVATRITGIPELLRDGIDGLLVTPSDAAELADAIATLIANPVRAAALAGSARARVGEHYNLETNVGRLAQLFHARFGAGVA